MLKRTSIATAVLAAAGVSGTAAAQDSDQERIDALERKIQILSEEIEGSRREGLVSEEFDYQPAYGVGPAGAKIYSVDQGLSIGGYGHGFYRNSSAEGADEADFYRQIFYVGYRFNDWLLLNTEIEFEHTNEAYTEFAYLDFLLSEKANVRAGLMLTPMGFVNEIHEPPTYFGNIRPEVEKRIIPTTSRENGVGLYGNLTDSLEYRVYVQNSFNGISDGASNIEGYDLRGIRQKGGNALAEDLAVTGRIDWKPQNGVMIGGSFWTGEMGHGQEIFAAGDDPETDTPLGTPGIQTNLYEVHAEYKRGGWWLRGLAAQAQFDDADLLSQSLADENVGETMNGWYAEVGYDIMPWIADRPEQALYPWVRHTDLETQASMPKGYDADPANDRTITEVGLHYMPHPNVVVKVDYRDFRSEADDSTNNQDELQLGIGYNF